MRNLNYKQERKFKKQVSHLSGFVGMPMWNGRNPSLSDIREFDRRILEKQVLGLESQKSNLLLRLSKSLKQHFVNAFTLASNTKKKTVNIKYGLPKSSNIDVECCG